MWFENTNLIWRNPLPYLRDPISLLVYGGMYLFKGTNMNIGFGTKTPYMLVGAPWLETSFLMKKLADFNEADLITCFSNDYGYEKWIEKAKENIGPRVTYMP